MAEDAHGATLESAAVEFEAHYTCTFCKHAPATHLLVADLVRVDNKHNGRYVLLVCQSCGIQGIADCRNTADLFKNPQLFKLAKFDVQVYPHG